jgi:hypothetical protein
MITLAAVLKQMENGSEPFHLRFVTFNKSKKEGGKIIELNRAVKVGAKYSLNDNDIIPVKQLDNSNHPYPVHIHLITEFNHIKVHF